MAGRLTLDAVPRKCTKRFLKGFRDLIIGGVKPIDAAQVMGINRTTFYEWLDLIERESDSEGLHASLRELNNIIHQGQAEAKAALILLAKYHIKSTSDAIRLLEKVDPENYGNRASSTPDNLDTNQLIVGIVKEMNTRQALMAAAEGIIDAEIIEDFGTP